MSLKGLDVGGGGDDRGSGERQNANAVEEMMRSVGVVETMVSTEAVGK